MAKNFLLLLLLPSYGSNGPMMPYKQRGSYPDAIVGYDGTVSVVPDTHLDAKCEGVDLDDRWAEHHCELRFGSWTYDGEHISLKVHKEHMDLTDFRGINQLQVGGKSKF